MKTVLTVLLFIASACSGQQAVVAAGPDVAVALTKRFADQTLLLRHAIANDSQIYDATGKLLTSGEEGSWTLYAGLRPTRIGLSDEELRIDGDRILFLYDKTEKMMVPERSKEKLQVVIQLARPLTTADDAVRILQPVFAMNGNDLIKSAPEFWRSYLAKEAEAPRAAQQLGLPAPKRKHSWFNTRQQRKAHVFRAGDKKLRPPEAIFTPEPSYTEIASDRGLQGSVVIDAIVDTAGKVLRPQVIKPLGMGLDEKAVETVQTWKFKPGTRKGHPVMIEMAVEIYFKLVY